MLLRSASGELALLRALDSAAYRKFSQLLHSLPEAKVLSARRFASALRAVFGTACDPDAQGLTFVVDGATACPKCGSMETDEEYESTEPPVLIDWDEKPVEHSKWQATDDARRIAIARQALLKFLNP